MRPVKVKTALRETYMNTSNYYSIGIDAHKQFCKVHILS